MILNIRTMVRCALFAALLAVCGWISIPIPPVAVTLQTFGVLLTLGILGGKRGTASILLYLAMGMLGLPVFAGFRGGAGVLLDATGGFLWGFAAGCLVYRAAERLGTLPAMILCQLSCYLFGCLWFRHWAGDISFAAAAAICIVPYLLPDLMKLWLAWHLSGRIGKHLK